MASNEKQQKARELFDKGYKLIEIARELDIPDGTIRRWKKELGWDQSERTNETPNERTNKRTNVKKLDKKRDTIKKDIKSIIKNEELTDRQKLFCMYQVRMFNATKAYLKAYGGTYGTAAVEAHKLLKNPKIIDLINSLKLNRMNRELFTEDDLFQRYMDIAYSDIKEFTTFGQKEIEIEDKEGNTRTKNVNYIDIHDSENVDGSLISEISEGKDGIKVKLLDKMKAMQWLSDHMDFATAEQRARIKLIEKQTQTGIIVTGQTGIILMPEIIEVGENDGDMEVN